MKTIAFFANEGGVGNTSLVYHLAWMYADLGYTVVAADLDPQANLTSMFVDDGRLEELWLDGTHSLTIYGALQPLLDGVGGVGKPHIEKIAERLGLVVGDLALSSSEDELSSQWPECLDRKVRAFRVLTAFWRIIEFAGRESAADVVLIDVGPNLGAINRAALICAAHVVIPLAPDLCSLQGLKNLGPRLRQWRDEWSDRSARKPASELSIPGGDMRPAGYVVMQHAVRLDRPVQAYDRWMKRIPGQYRQSVLNEETPMSLPVVSDDPHCLAALKHNRSLIPLAQESRKPMFSLTAADGALGGHGQAVRECYQDFRGLAVAISNRCGFHLAWPRESVDGTGTARP